MSEGGVDGVSYRQVDGNLVEVMLQHNETKSAMIRKSVRMSCRLLIGSPSVQQRCVTKNRLEVVVLVYGGDQAASDFPIC